MFGLFSKAKSITLDDVGELKYKDRAWQGNIELGKCNLELSLDGDKNGPEDYCVDFINNNSKKLNLLWNDAIEFARQQMREKKINDSIVNSNFNPVAVSIHEQGSFDGGELVFWFEIESDKGGGYYVSFKGEQPVNFHRD